MSSGGDLVNGRNRTDNGNVHDAVVPNDYDSFAREYAEQNDNGPFNAYYERPASLALVGDAAGKRVLDVGCGTGAHSAELLRRGAVVTGIDKSAGLLAIARKRLGRAVALHHHDLAEPLPFADGSFDIVLAALVLHYLHDWQPVLREFRRVLVADGRLVVSTHHPFADHALGCGKDYFATYAITEEWRYGDRAFTMQFWHRPLHAMTDAFTEAGFRLERVSEPQPDASAKDFEDAFERLTTAPSFLFFVASPAKD